MASSDFQSKLNFDLSVTIANAATESSAVDLYGTSLVGFITDAAISSAAITFKGCDTLTGTFLPIKKMIDGANITAVVSATTAAYYITDPDDFCGVRFIKLVGGTTQTGATTITLITRSIN